MQTHYPRKPSARKSRRAPKPAYHPRMHPDAEPVLKNVFARIGKPAETPFVPDEFQLRALDAINQADCIVIAPTGSGKTWIAEQAIMSVFNKRGRCWYASPLKALTNAKWVEFADHFQSDNVGIVTGDTKENIEAPIIVGTTEILRNQLYDSMHRGKDLPCDLVILDEAHFLGDKDRGVVWEEIMIYLPARINLLLLSATIGNGQEIADWLSSLRGKPCTVITEERRPVPLFPLFLHPTGRLMPFLEQNRLFGRVGEFVRSQGKYGRPPHFGEIIAVLKRYHLLPAIFFLKSRSECDAALKSCHPTADFEDDIFGYELDEHLERFPYLKHHKQLHYLEHCLVAAHHGGQLPAWKFLVEIMMKRGHLQAIFATSTVAAGVNFPARTIVLFNSDLFNGREFAPLTGIEFHQMTGRAGRRGQDKIGFMLSVPGRFMDLNHVKKLLSRKPENIESRIRSDFSMVLNLLLSQTPDDVKAIFEKSLAAFQSHSKSGRQGGSLWDDFCRHLDFLKAEGFVDDQDRLTDNGRWASKLRLDQPLLIAECLRRDVLPRTDEKLFAAVIAPFVYDGDQEAGVPEKKIPRKLRSASQRVALAVKPLIGRMKAAGFAVNRQYFWPAYAIYTWAQGNDWEHIIRTTGLTDGDLAMLVLRTADNLRQITSLGDTHPDMAAVAARARECILREPVVME
jgi:ATP-dependent RNA helicase HelY